MDTNYTILVVDDREVQRYALGRTLEAAGFRVIPAGTGAEALAAALGEKPDLVLLDINLPDANGVDIAHQLKSNPISRHIPIVFHSASSSPTDSAYRDVPALGTFLTFPIERDHLLHVIQGTLARAARKAE